METTRILHINERAILNDGAFCRVLDRRQEEGVVTGYLIKISQPGKGCKKKKWVAATEVGPRNNVQPMSKVKSFIVKHVVNTIKKRLGGCAVCGEDDACCVEFHHIGDKTQDVSKIAKSRQFQKVVRELNKCICLCSNCHKKHHSGRLEVPLDRRIVLDEEILAYIFDVWLREARALVESGLGHEAVSSIMSQKVFDPLARVKRHEVVAQ